MELPVFQDNLRSSGGWAAELEKARAAWAAALEDASLRPEIEARLRNLQSSEARARAAISGAKLEEPRLLAAAELVTKWARAESQANGAPLDPERLKELYRTLSGATDANPLRRLEAVRRSEAHDPAPAALLDRLLANAFDWFGTPSFAEIHPVEKAALVHLRLIDLQPFPALNEEVSLLAASVWTERGGLPPLIIYGDEETSARYAGAIEAAFRMLTQPLVELIAGMLERTVRAALETKT